MIGVAALIIALVLGFRKQFAALAFMLRMGPALLLAVLVVLGLWGLVDFNGLFAAFITVKQACDLSFGLNSTAGGA